MKTLIIAPHVDDELIGCYTALLDFQHSPKEDSLDVIWLYETTEERLREGQALADHFGFTGAALFSAEVPDVLEDKNYDFVYVPARQDWHADHKRTNQLFRQVATHFYSVDMVGGTPLSVSESMNKKKLLDQFYPSQASLWAADARYYLFSAVSLTDINKYVRHRFEKFSIVVLTKYQNDAHAVVTRNYHDFVAGEISAFDKLVSVCPTGEVTFDHLDGRIYKI